MKRYMTFILFIFITVGTWASGAAEQNNPTSYRFYTEKLVFNEQSDVMINEADGVQVFPSSTVIGLIDDYIYDVYDDDDYEDIRLPKTDVLFSNIEEYVAEGADYSEVSKFFSLYVDDVLADNTDDILYYINDELLTGLKESGADASFMILGDTKIKAVRDFTN